MMLPLGLTHTIYTGQAANSGPSPKLWSQIRSVGISPDGFARGYYAGSEFMGFGGLLTTTSGDYADEGGSYSAYQDSSCTIVPVATTGGQITIATDGTDNNECWLQYGGATNTLGAISTTAGSDKLTIFEARVKFSTNVANGHAFIGLAQEGFAANSAIADADTYADKDLLGFRTNKDTPTALDFVHYKSGGTPATGTAIDTNIAGTIGTTAFVNMGFIYNPQEVAAKKIKIYINNALNDVFGTSTTLALATFPLDGTMTFTAGVKNSTTAAKAITLDWWHWWQEA